MKRAALAFLLCSSVAYSDPLSEMDRLEALDARIQDTATLHDHPSLWAVSTRAALGAWTPSSTLEVKSLADGVQSFTLRFTDGTVRGFYPSSHCCTEVIFAGLETSSEKWSFLGSLRVGSTVSEVLNVLGRDAKREKQSIAACGAHDCIYFFTQHEKVVRVEIRFYTG